MKSKSKSKSSNPFEFQFKDDVLQVWLGNPDDIESEFVLQLDKAYLASFIAVLRKAQDS
jgi:hypothetical protein